MELLKQATGYLLPGQTHYIMGPSGAGKTTLLNAISGRLRTDKQHVLEGTRELDDCIKLSQHSFGKYGAYVMQDDVLYEYFTVKEALMFAAKLKLNTTNELRQHRVMQLIVELGLIKCMNTQIGSTLRKTISGGEKKRTAIGVELITDPSLVILDEPTSGLDSFMAVSIIKTLHRLSRNRGKTILATIHQPSSTAFKYFDRLILIAEGRIIYQGAASRSASYFQKCGYQLPRYSNPADGFMKLMSTSCPPTEDDKNRIQHLNDEYSTRKLQKIEKELMTLSFQSLKDAIQVEEYRSGYCQSLIQLTIRNEIGLIRNPASLLGRIVISVFVSLTSLSCFWHVGQDLDGASGLQKEQLALDLASSMFFTCIAQLSLYEFATVMEFQKERAVFIREKTSKLYTIGPYYFSKIVLEMPLLLLLPFLENLMTFFAIGYSSVDYNFFRFYLVYVLTVQVGTAMGYFISCCFDNMMAASQVTPFAVMPSVLFGGFVVNLTTLRPSIYWMQYVSPTRYAFEALCWCQWPNDSLGIQEKLGFTLGYDKCVVALMIMVVVYRAITLFFFSFLTRNGFK